ncbi:MAG TPA: hypothetical protein DDY59_10520, partial [Lachnospiraceae bacterium]|nr:hypothetical protein [Lachnospiraceae bacterium]
ELAEFIKEIKKENESILLILNTKKTAESVFKAVKDTLKDPSIVYYFLSTNLCPAHRKNIIKQMKKDLKQHKQVICVST